MDNYTFGIVGMGLTGLTIAYKLAKANIQSIIFEASCRAGGRIWTEKFPNGQTYELGGQYINSEHYDIMELIRELGLELGTNNISPDIPDKYLVIDYDQPDCPLVLYTLIEIENDYKQISYLISSDAKIAKKLDLADPIVKKLDNIDLDTYINNVCSRLRSDLCGAKTKLAQIIKIAYQVMYGLEPKFQSTINFLLLIGSDPDKFELFGSADEKYYIKGGTQRLTDKLYELLKLSNMCTIYLDTPITKITKNNEGYMLNSRYKFSHIVMTIPFQMYDIIDYTEARFSELKQYIIKNYKLGNSSKINIQLDDSLKLDFNGTSFVSVAKMNQCQNTWNGTIDNYDHDSLILVNYTGGEHATHISNEFLTTDPTKLVRPLNELNVIFENTHKPNILNTVGINWSFYPWTKGAYSVYKVGQYAGGPVPFAGLEGQTEYQCYFAGEATDIESQGYMNAAVVSANRVVNEILTSVLIG
jgi:monoamine oxidase